MQLREGMFDREHVARLMWLRPRPVAIGMVGLSEQSVERKMAQRAGSPEHRSVNGEVTTQLDRSLGRRDTAEPPVQHNAGHRARRRLSEDQSVAR